MRRSMLGWPALAVVALGSAHAESVGAAPVVPRFAYAANSADNTISMYAVDAATGQLRHTNLNIPQLYRRAFWDRVRRLCR
jgi:hypothetical protein